MFLGVLCQEVTLTRREIFLLIKDELTSSFSNQIELIEQQLFKMKDCSFKISNTSKIRLKPLLSKMKTKWQNAHRTLQAFYDKNNDWLDVKFIFTVSTYF